MVAKIPGAGIGEDANATSLTLKNIATADNSTFTLNLQTAEADIAQDDVLGKINFQAPAEGTGTDANLIAASIQATSEGDFSSSSNATKLEFMTGSSEAATSQMTISSGGIVGIGATLPGDLGTGLHIKTADSGASATSHGDELVIEDGTAGANVGISILSATDGEGRINFGDSGDNDIGMVRYNHADDSMTLITSNANGLVIDSTGAITKPLQPAFCAKPASNQSDINCVDTNVTVIFGTEIFDVNADFAPSPYGIFTAPVTGKYQLQVNLYLSDFDASADYLQADLVTSNNNYHAIWETTDEDSYATLNIACTADMDANDTASVRLFQGSGGAQVDVRVSSRFSGHLAC